MTAWAHKKTEEPEEPEEPSNQKGDIMTHLNWQRESMIDRLHDSLDGTRDSLIDEKIDLRYNAYYKIRDESRRIKNAFTDNGDGTVTDRATGLVWEKSGSSNNMLFKDAQCYIQGLNEKKFAGYSDWRLPALEELASLLENKKVSDRCIDPVFDCKGTWYFSADTRASGDPLGVHFVNGSVVWRSPRNFYYVRGVRFLTM